MHNSLKIAMKEKYAPAKTKQVVTSLVGQNQQVEMVYDSASHQTGFYIQDETGLRFEPQLIVKSKVFLPYGPDHPFVKDRVILFAQQPESYGEVAGLIKLVKQYIHRYVDLSEEFELIATHYVLLTWLFDCHTVLGYLRIKGDFGTGKTRFLTVIGSVCYKPIFASGAATVAPLFHLLNDIGGTLVMDESDFHHSNEKSLIAKILNNGNAKGFPVLRCEKTKQHNFTAKAFNVFGPKILACRGAFDDLALESRFLTENAGVRPLRATVPLRLDHKQDEQAQSLRNRLLQFRFDYFKKKQSENNLGAIDAISPRMQQIIRPLLQFMSTDEQDKVIAWCQQQEGQQLRDRGMELAAQIITVLLTLLKIQSKVQIGEIRRQVIKEYGDHFDFPPTAKAIGIVVRNTLHLNTSRVNGRYVVDAKEIEKIKLLAQRYGVHERP